MAVQPHRRHSEKHLVDQLFDRAQMIMNWGTRIVGLLGISTFFSWLVGGLLHNYDELTRVDRYLWQGCTILYFTSWIAGVSMDKSIQEKVYVSAPEQLRINYLSMISAFIIYTLFGLMFIAVFYGVTARSAQSLFPVSAIVAVNSKNAELAFTALLNALWIVNVPIWLHYVHRYINPIERRSEAAYRADRDYVGLLKVRVIKHYIKGSWQWQRFAVGGILLASLDVVTWLWRASDNVSLVVSLSLVGFLVVVEAWIWLMRLRVEHSIALINEIARHYRIMPHREHSPPEQRTRRKDG